MDCSKFILLLVLSLGVMIDCQSPCDYTPYEDAEVWLKYHEKPADWDTAQQQCAAEGALLASPTDDLSQLLKDIVLKFATTPVVTGIRVFYFTGSYLSVEGTSSHEKFPSTWNGLIRNGGPNKDKGKVKCVILNQNGTMERVDCNQHYPFICYKSYVNVERGCDTGYTLSTVVNSCHKLHRKKLIHDRAEEVCVKEGGQLLVINSEAESLVIKDLLKQAGNSTYHLRIGFRKVNDTWITVNGKTLAEEGYSKFGPGEPNNSTGYEDCGSIQRDTVMLNDMPCNTTNSNFICEKNPYCVNKEIKIDTVTN